MLSSGKPWRMLSPLMIVLVLWGAWSGFWFFLSSTAQDMAQDWRTRVAPNGISLTCAEETWGGYPFRIEVGCTEFRLANGKGPKKFVARAQAITAVTQAYKPWHVILQISPPLSFQFPARKAAAEKMVVSASHDPGLASIRLDDNYKPHVSLLLNGLRGNVEVGETDFSAGKFSIGSANVHLRPEETSRPDHPTLGVAVSFENFEFDGHFHDLIDSGPIVLDKLTFNGALEGLPDHSPGTTEALLRSWATNRGRLRIHQLNAERTPIVVQTSGEISIDAKGLLHGKINAKVQNLHHVIDRLEQSGRLSPGDARVSKELFKVLSGNRPDGEIVSDFRLRSGNLYFGPFKLAKIPPLF